METPSAPGLGWHHRGGRGARAWVGTRSCTTGQTEGSQRCVVCVGKDTA